jgi:hypothetical protein
MWHALAAAVRGALLAAAAWGLAVWVLWRHHEWVDGRYVRNINWTTLLFNGPAGPQIRSFADHFLARIGASPNIIDYARWLPGLLSVHVLLLFAIKVGAIRGVLALLGWADISRREAPPTIINAKLNNARLARKILLEISLFGIVVMLLGVPEHVAVLFIVVLGVSLVPAIGGTLISPIDGSTTKGPLDTFRADRRATLGLGILAGLGGAAQTWLFLRDLYSPRERGIHRY